MNYKRNWLLSFFLIAALLPFSSQANDKYRLLVDEFDARGMSQGEKRFLQAALAFQGYYNGLQDGKWGRGSQASIERYSQERYSVEPLNIHSATLAFDFLKQIEASGWKVQNFPRFGISFAFPAKVLVAIKNTERLSFWKDKEESVELAVWLTEPSELVYLHQKLAGEVGLGKEVYELRTEETWVTSLEDRQGRLRYMRSDLVSGTWASVAITAKPEKGEILNGIATSISKGFQQDYSVEENGKIARLTELALAWAEEDSAAEKKEKTARKDPKGIDEPKPGLSSGTGFYINLSGSVLTNQHVVENCSQVFVNQSPATVVAASVEFDLALLNTGSMRGSSEIARFSPDTAHLNEDVTVIGYPLKGLLGGLNVTRGAVTATKGISGDFSTMQISAPVQSGNSGGPVVDETGSVVGVVVSKLDAKRYADLAGEITQNINFAIRGEIAKLFLSSSGETFFTNGGEEVVHPVTIAKRAQNYTALITCFQN